ncbi:hypothetical protein EJB05_28822 [Eragrostis curvula]|uniref:Uncharacterized protein n=1 Tax=Eragrostis curvula TaxID=38414 RepID=A0A5J9UR93_9POAL|nr:hypothetical protein EJB05_28822 [Eragrostis curvula]
MAGRGSIPASACRFFHDYDLDGLKKLLASLGDCSIEDEMKALRENLESFKKPTACVDDNEEDHEDDDDDEEEETVKDEDLELIGDEKKPASVEQTLLIGDEIETASGEQVTGEGERLYKKPRLAEGFGFLGEAEAS